MRTMRQVIGNQILSLLHTSQRTASASMGSPTPLHVIIKGEHRIDEEEVDTGERMKNGWKRRGGLAYFLYLS